MVPWKKPLPASSQFLHILTRLTLENNEKFSNDLKNRKTLLLNSYVTQKPCHHLRCPSCKELNRTIQEDEGNFIGWDVWRRCPSVFSFDRNGALLAFDTSEKMLCGLFGGGSIPRPTLASKNLPNCQTFPDGFSETVWPTPERL